MEISGVTKYADIPLHGVPLHGVPFSNIGVLDIDTWFTTIE